MLRIHRDDRQVDNNATGMERNATDLTLLKMMLLSSAPSVDSFLAFQGTVEWNDDCLVICRVDRVR